MTRGDRKVGPVGGAEAGSRRLEEAKSMSSSADASVIWHDVECGSYGADLPLWLELAERADGPILDLGCGTGRVLRHLALRGHEVIGLDLNASLVRGLDTAQVGDARSFELSQSLGLVLAPMQLLQLLAGPNERESCLGCVAAHLRPGGLAAFAIVEPVSGELGDAHPLPDVRETGGWVYSSLPLETRVEAGAILVRRLRQTVSPSGELHEEVDEVCLQAIGAGAVEREAQAAGLRPAGRRSIPPTEAHIGSTVILLERGS